MAEVAATSTPQKEPIKASEIDPKFKYELQKMPWNRKNSQLFPMRHMHLRLPSCTLQRQLSATHTHPHGTTRLKRPCTKQRYTLAMCSMLHMHRPLPTRRRSRKRHPSLPQPCRRERLCSHRSSKTKPQSLTETGYAYKIPELRIKKRETQGLAAAAKRQP